MKRKSSQIFLTEQQNNDWTETAIGPYQSAIGSATAIGDLNRQIVSHLQEAIEIQGSRALDNPRSAAIAHESSHAVVYAACGETVTRIKIWRLKRGDYRGQYRGETITRPWQVDPSTSPEQDFQVACCLFSGVLGEIIFDMNNFRMGSSVDEVASVHNIAAQIAKKLGTTIGIATEQILAATAEALRNNSDVVHPLMRELDIHEVVRRKKLAALLSAVRPQLALNPALKRGLI